MRGIGSITMTLIGIITAVSFMTRFYNLSTPAYVCWDETHFGKFASHYINRTYFVDVHPPLGKMLIALAGLLTGYDGKFAFTSPGEDFGIDNNKTNYCGMRAFSAFLGSIVTPMLVSTVKNVSHSNGAALLTAMFLIFDCGLITLSQYILLEPILLFFTSTSLLCTSNIDYAKTFSWQWWLYLALSGLFLGCAMSVKWTGTFTAIFIGYWNTISVCGERKNKKNIVVHVLARATFLIFVPGCFYISIFALHYQVLNKTGKDDGFHSSLFQSCLQGNPLHKASMPLYLAFGSVISMKYRHPSVSGLLYSSPDLYPPESTLALQKQVSLYHHRDVNNFWQVTMPLEHLSEESNHDNKDDGIKYISDRNLIHLMHFRTKHYLSSQRSLAVLSPQEFVVSGQYNTSRLDQLWRLEVVREPGINGRVAVLTTVFKLVHVNTGCYLRSSAKILPNWGGERYEVTCSLHSYHAKWSLWNIEQHTHRKMRDVEVPYCQMTFWERLRESHVAMFFFNFQLGASENGSKVWHWPLNLKGQAFSRMGEGDTRVYLLGNPLIFMLNILVIILWSLTRIIVGYKSSRKRYAGSSRHYLRTRVTFSELLTSNAKNVLLSSHSFRGCDLFMFGWICHYFPFFFVSRVVYFHHYYPAFLFNCCASGCFLDAIFTACSKYFLHVRRNYMVPLLLTPAIYTAFILCLFQSFYLYLPLCYGMTGPYSAHIDSSMRGLNVFGLWDI